MSASDQYLSGSGQTMAFHEPPTHTPTTQQSCMTVHVPLDQHRPELKLLWLYPFTMPLNKVGMLGNVEGNAGMLEPDICSKKAVRSFPCRCAVACHAVHRTPTHYHWREYITYCMRKNKSCKDAGLHCNI